MDAAEPPILETKYNDENKEEDQIINILNDNNYDNIESKEVICSECKERAFININNYQINLFGCKNGHSINNILFENYENIQKVSFEKKICQNCKKNYKNNKELYKCFSCNIVICSECTLNHSKEHKIVNNDKIKYRYHDVEIIAR